MKQVLVEIRCHVNGKPVVLPSVKIEKNGQTTTRINKSPVRFTWFQARKGNVCAVVQFAALPGYKAYLPLNHPVAVSFGGIDFELVARRDDTVPDQHSFTKFCTYSITTHLIFALALYLIPKNPAVAPKIKKPELTNERVAALLDKMEKKKKPVKKKVVKKKKPVKKKVVKKKKLKPVKKTAKKRGSKKVKKKVAKRNSNFKKGGGAKLAKSNKPRMSASQRKAKAVKKAQMAASKSLSFLSSSSSRPKKAVKANYRTGGAKYTKLAKAVSVTSKGQSRYVAQIASAPEIETANLRTIGGDTNIGGGGRGVSGVQGQVAVGNVYQSGDGDGSGFGSVVSGDGLKMSGPGSLSQSEIEKVLKKYLNRFQYCYEKVLLSDSSLGGSVMLTWNIQSGGSTNSVRVIKSEINNSNLHRCLSKEINKIRFPSPRGGAVQVKYPFAFSASSI